MVGDFAVGVAAVATDKVIEECDIPAWFDVLGVDDADLIILVDGTAILQMGEGSEGMEEWLGVEHLSIDGTWIGLECELQRGACVAEGVELKGLVGERIQRLLHLSKCTEVDVVVAIEAVNGVVELDSGRVERRMGEVENLNASERWGETEDIRG